MNINTGLNTYSNSSYVNNASDRGKISQNQSLTGTVSDSLKEGEVFEGSVNSIENGKVTIGLANGQTMTARLDSGVSLTPGQSIFFEVKSNDGNLVQIRPVSLNGLEANPTLLKALDMANIAATERTLNMVNSMMQNSMSISPENLAAMNRAMINNPEVDLQTLVTMTKHGMELTPDNVNMFQNYATDKAVISDNLGTISEALPELMLSDELSAGDVIAINNAIKEIFIPEDSLLEAQIPQANVLENINLEASEPLEEQAVNNVPAENQPLAMEDAAETVAVFNQEDTEALSNIPANQTDAINQDGSGITESKQPEDQAVIATDLQAETEAANSVSENGTRVLNDLVANKQIEAFENALKTLPDFPKENNQIFAENGSLKPDADIKQVFKEITDYLNGTPDLSKDAVNNLVKQPLFKEMLKSIISNSFSLEPKDVTKPGELSKLYEKLEKQTESLEKLVSQFNNKSADLIKNQTNEIRQNISFMNSANEMYNFVQIPLKMYNQNTDSMLYVKQNKKSSYEAGEEITAFLHFDMEYLGSTDVFISLKEANVGCKWNLASEDSMKLIEDNLDILTERLAKKGFNVSSEVTCGEKKPDFVEDFLGEPTLGTETSGDGLVHRYSFDMRA